MEWAPLTEQEIAEIRKRDAQARLRRNLTALFLYAFLVLLLVLVLSPMLWMIATALKSRGTALQLKFLPTRSLYSPPQTSRPLQLPAIREGERYLHLEWSDPSATTVTAVLLSGTETESTHPLSLAFEGTWTTTAGPLESRPSRILISVNGQEPQPLTDQPVRLNAAGISSPSPPRFLVYRDPSGLQARIQASEGRSLSIVLDGRTIPLNEQEPGLYTVAGADAQGTEYRVREKIGGAEALSRMYTLANFKRILTAEDFNFGRYFFNSVVVSAVSGLLTIFLCAMAAYAFARMPFHFRKGLFIFLLCSMLVPGMIYMVPQFSITLRLGLMNTYPGMIVPHLANVFGLYLIYQYIADVPDDLFAAAHVDGAGHAQVFLRIVLPICLPIMLTLFLLVFVTQWSNFLWQLIINTGDSEVLTLPVGLQQFKGQNANEWEAIMAGACFSILPIAVLFLALQRYFLEALTAGSVKE